MLTLDSKVVISQSAVESFKGVYDLGQRLYETFVTERITTQTKSVAQPIRKNKLSLFSKSLSLKQKSQVSALKDDCAFFSRLYIACQSREGKLEEFFKFENQPWPPSLSKSGEMRSGKKSDLLPPLEGLSNSDHTVPQITAVVLDGAMVVHSLSPVASKTFSDYVTQVFVPHIQNILKNIDRVDIVFDVYNEQSLKTSTREKRGSGVRKKVTLTTQISGNWQSFLRNNNNKIELFSLLAEHAAGIEEDNKQVLCTLNEQVVCNAPVTDKSFLEPCTQEEADTRTLLHVVDAANKGHQRILTRTADTDVVVLAVACFHQFKTSELWISFGTGKFHRYIAIHEIIAVLPSSKAQALPFFHAFTGCDVISFFARRGKKSAWETWHAFPEVTEAFLSLLNPQCQLTESSLALIEGFVVLWYDRTCEFSNSIL